MAKIGSAPSFYFLKNTAFFVTVRAFQGKLQIPRATPRNFLVKFRRYIFVESDPKVDPKSGKSKKLPCKVPLFAGGFRCALTMSYSYVMRSHEPEIAPIWSPPGAPQPPKVRFSTNFSGRIRSVFRHELVGWHLVRCSKSNLSAAAGAGQPPRHK